MIDRKKTNQTETIMEYESLVKAALTSKKGADMHGYNVWLSPEGYQRTSRRIQQRCLQWLMSFGTVSGHVLDVGCGTGNALDNLTESVFDTYLGVDISPEMTGFAKQRHRRKHVEFIAQDFLSFEGCRDSFYNTVICAACLHWFFPHERQVIEKIRNTMAPGGSLFLSCAADFHFIQAERDAQAGVLDSIRQRYQPVAAQQLFDTRRFSDEKLKDLSAAFELMQIDRIEERLDFTCFEDFRDWHMGSGSVVYSQFSVDDRDAATQEYYRMLYDQYTSGDHAVGYSTALMLLRKR